MRRFLVLSALVAVTYSRPQEFASEDEVELVPAINTNDGEPLDGEKDPVVVVLRLPGFGGGNNRQDGGDGGFGGFGGGGFPGFSGFPGFGAGAQDNSGFPFSGFLGGSGRPRIPTQAAQNPFDLVDDIFDGILDGLPRGDVYPDVVEDDEVEFVEPVENTPAQRPAGCGLICTMFGLFSGLQDEIDNINDEMHGSGNGFHHNFPGLGGLIPSRPSVQDTELDVNNSTYEVKVLDDGTKVAVNTTTFADKDDNGNTFFVQTTFTQMINNDNLPALPEVEDVAYDYYAEPEEGVTEDAVPTLNDYGTDYFVINEADSETASETANETASETGSETASETDGETASEIDNVLPSEDPSINEINDGIDTGLKQE